MTIDRSYVQWEVPPGFLHNYQPDLRPMRDSGPSFDELTAVYPSSDRLRP